VSTHVNRQKVVVATRNRGKLKEILKLLDAERLGFDLVTIDEIAPNAVLIEDEPTFEGNALAKARQASAATGLPALADDSGLEVDALEGEPGVRSARYAGEPSDDAKNNAKLIAAMNAMAAEARPGTISHTARFRCAAAYVSPVHGTEVVTTGSCEGEIITTPRGEQGFGYDPLFLIPALDRTLAELTIDEKNSLSHRAAAFRALADVLSEV